MLLDLATAHWRLSLGTGGLSWGQLTTILDAVDFPPWKGLRAESTVYWQRENLTFGDAGNAIWVR